MAASPYLDIVLAHRRAPRNFGSLAAPTHAADGTNALCGDRLRVEIECRDGRIAQLRFSGESCAIAIASASIMSELVAGADATAVADLEARLCALVAGTVARDEILRDANAFAELRNHAARRKCALLPWAAAIAALAGSPTASTE